MERIGTCSQGLVGLLKGKGIPAVYHEDYGIVSIPNHPYRMALEVHKVSETVVSMQAICEVGPDKFMKETLAGLGETQAEALMDAQLNFISCVFHVWVSGLLGTANALAQERIWNINGKERDVTVGFPAGRSGNADVDLTQDAGWQRIWQEAVCAMPLSDELHWASLCYVQQKGKVIAFDALLDNEVCEPVKEKVLAWDWPVHDCFYSVRQFMIIQPAE